MLTDCVIIAGAVALQLRPSERQPTQCRQQRRKNPGVFSQEEGKPSDLKLRSEMPYYYY